jgi:Tol biopolymer transport system component
MREEEGTMNRLALQVWGIAIVLGSIGWAQVTQRVSVDSGGAEGNNNSRDPSISADGRYVAFESAATNLVPGDTNSFYDIFVRDRQNGTTERVSVSSAGAQGDLTSYSPSISADGRYVAFYSFAANLVPGDTNGAGDVFLRDRQSGATERVSVSSGGVQGNSYSGVSGVSISADGRYVAFHSAATNLVPGDTNGGDDVFLRDRLSGTTERMSIDSGGVQGNSSSYFPSISADGRYVAFQSFAGNLVPGDTNVVGDVFLRDRQTSTTERVSISSVGVQGNFASDSSAISADGRYVAFASTATNLVSGDTNGVSDVFLRDRLSGTTERVSVSLYGYQGNGSSYAPSISADGLNVAFLSSATNLVLGDTNGFIDAFVRDRGGVTTDRVSVSSGGVQGNGESHDPSISADGRYVAFDSGAAFFVPGDTNGAIDIFVRDRDATGFTSLCDPGVGGVIGCPCFNPPSGSGHGCNNSAATGGAVLTASGIAYLSMDSLVFTTSGEKPVALSIVLQGNALLSSGLVYGQGVRCAGGTLKRLFNKIASAGSITAPDFGAGDPTVSARSAAKGDPILPGQSRWYLVYYRDPTVLGGCSASSTFNTTQTGHVSWSL